MSEQPITDQAATRASNLRLSAILATVIVAAMIGSLLLLLSISDTVYLKTLVDDSGAVQLTGQTAIACAFASCLFYTLFDTARRNSYLMLSFLLMIYTLREADYHYKVSEHAKATQFKRFFMHELIPISSKLFLIALVILFFFTLIRYLRQNKETFMIAVADRQPWAVFGLFWGLVFFLSQLIDQVPIFHNVYGQVFEEVFESAAEIIALSAVFLFRFQLRKR